ncbi:SDR family NAD(P)-dependent oxidoreductase [Chitinophaga pendula]|uniref:SDR family NAD(P)-dependent oxidoreductase n=1 Tax=Chitinophaga TaxID=79328 RepID=UPI000BB0A6F3|nr:MULTISPECIES: SDR family NAD(P)-dependent oxidoreductase [Chitinophaga]ASZ12669.1 short-chain dehydrogenase [Chitinophaga sp. MD30]UCJ09720.1 SDR family NAD(P)-dependent oxidoreductase [Chitinophaga pendula]
MNTDNKTVLVTGGGAGIGLAIATAFAERGNKVIIVGRDAKKLQAAEQRSAHITGVACDISDVAQVDKLVKLVAEDLGGIDILVNNAGVLLARPGMPDIYEKSKAEFEINFFSVIRLTDQLLPLLRQRPEAAIVNVSSATAFSPLVGAPSYSASKAALHSYTRSLRLILSREAPQLKVFEVLPGYVDTDMASAITSQKMNASDLAQELLDGLHGDQLEIFPGPAKEYYPQFLAAPLAFAAAFNGLA